MTRGLTLFSIPDCFYSKHVHKIFSNRCANRPYRVNTEVKRKDRAGFAPKTGNKKTDALFMRTKTEHSDIKK